MEHSPAKLILFELSELALYELERELLEIKNNDAIEIVPVLGSITDARHVGHILKQHQVEIVLHAAAYKHVLLVEANVLVGMENKVLGTHILASEAAKTGVARFILISSDKAVRPSNIMGASKRLAELIIQELANRVTAGAGPIYTSVRFGNVLGSSGSVIPLFQEQLKRGGPLTVTHPDVTQYFMTAQEAVHLVLCAGAMAKGGEAFVLDVGKPLRILDLAKQMIEAAGYNLRDGQSPRGDIGIEYSGLCPGEKNDGEAVLVWCAARH